MNAVLQRDTALRRANQVRSVNATLKRNIAAQDFDTGKLMVREAIGNPPVELKSVRVYDLLCSLRKVGSFKADRYLRRANVSPRRRIGELTDHERMRLDLVLR